MDFGTLRHRAGEELTSLALSGLFRYMGARLRLDSGFRALLGSSNGNGNGNGHAAMGREPYRDVGPWESRLCVKTRDGKLSLTLDFDGQRMRVRRGEPKDFGAALIFRDLSCARTMFTESPGRVLEMLLTGELVFEGNLSDIARLSFLLNALSHRSRLPGQRRNEGAPARKEVSLPPPRRALPMEPCDEVKYLEDPALSRYTIEDFPRLKQFKLDFFATTPEICTERAHLYTEAIRRFGFERDAEGRPVDPELRQAEAFYHLMASRAPLVREGDLLAGTTTAKDIGVVVYPECGGIPIWPELETVNRRHLNPYRIANEDIRVLNDEVFPYWMDRNVREYVRAKNGNPLSLRLDERFVFYFQWKTQAVSHTIADFPRVLSLGLKAIAREGRDHAAAEPDEKKRNFYLAAARSLEGVMAYAENLSRKAAELAGAEKDPGRREELAEISRICAKVPAGPAETLHEALQSMWIVWIGCHMENTNAGLSIGRVDQWLQPYFEGDLEKIADPQERRRYMERAVELLGCFFLRCTDHLPQVADLGNKLFGGSSSDQVITLGGVTREGRNGVADMTYLLLKVTEMLGLRDPNVNARYHEGINSPQYLRRLCEVNYLTGATPSIHGDKQVIDVLREQGMQEEDARDWSATGCVEPTSCGRHYGHTNCMMFNMVAPLEMALHRGRHPLVDEQVGPDTGDPRTFKSYAQFRDAYFCQLKWLIETAVEANNLLGKGHQFVRPTPYLSALIEGPFESGKDLIEGGAKYNSSGTGNVGLADVVDSLMSIKKLVFDERRVAMEEMLAALASDFEGHEKLLARILNRVPKFGSGDPEVLAVADEVITFMHRTFREQPHYRGGHYNSGFWSMSNHVAFGILSGALPSGRRKGKAFSPGLTPTGGRNGGILQQIHDVASLDYHKMPNNVAFNVKVVPHPGDTQAQALDQMSAYARSYAQQGGMQMQFNVVSSQTLRDAREHPENYPTLLVRISGYNAYFNDLNDDMKLELIERTEHCLGR